MRIATWNVNSLNARLEKLTWWLERAQPDVLLMQETKLSDADTPTDELARQGYELAHHGEGRWTVRRGSHDRSPLRRRAGDEHLRAERPLARLPILSCQACLVRTAEPLA